MPFDATTTKPSVLATIVREPLSESTVADHKKMVIDAFCAACELQADSYHSGRAQWKTTDITTKIDERLRYFAAPKKVRRLAARIHCAVPDATLSVQWFYRDPILSVTAEGETMHVAIWDRNATKSLVAIAKTIPWYQFWR